MLILLLLVISQALALTKCHALKGGRDALLDCFAKLVDTNHDNSIVPSETTAFFKNEGRTTILFKMCDLNNDGKLTSADWTAPNACATNQHSIFRTCYECERAGWTVPTN